MNERHRNPKKAVIETKAVRMSDRDRSINPKPRAAAKKTSNKACATETCKDFHVAKGSEAKNSIQLFIILISQDITEPVIVASRGKKARTISRISPNRITLESGTAIKLVMRK